MLILWLIFTVAYSLPIYFQILNTTIPTSTISPLLSLSPDGSTFLITNQQQCLIYQYNNNAYTQIQTLSDNPTNISTVQFANEQYVLIGNQNGNTFVYQYDGSLYKNTHNLSLAVNVSVFTINGSWLVLNQHYGIGNVEVKQQIDIGSDIIWFEQSNNGVLAISTSSRLLIYEESNITGDYQLFQTISISTEKYNLAISSDGYVLALIQSFSSSSNLYVYSRSSLSQQFINTQQNFLQFDCSGVSISKDNRKLIITDTKKSNLRIYSYSANRYRIEFSVSHGSITGVLDNSLSSNRQIIVYLGQEAGFYVLGIVYQCVDLCGCSEPNLCARNCSNSIVETYSCSCLTSSQIFSPTSLMCVDCSITNCIMCSTSETCLICDENYSLSNNSCSCIDTCPSCSIQGCNLCNSTIQCLKCSTDMILQSGVQSVCSCASNTSLYSQSYHTCISCQVDYCKMCAPADICLDCLNNLALDYSGNRCVCATGLTISSELEACIQCALQACQQCITISQCLTCINGTTKNNNTGLCQCSTNNEVYSTTTFTCISCQVGNCISCNVSDSCIVCSQEYILEEAGCSFNGTIQEIPQVSYNFIWFIIPFGVLIAIVLITLICRKCNKKSKMKKQIFYESPPIKSQNTSTVDDEKIVSNRIQRYKTQKHKNWNIGNNILEETEEDIAD